MSIAVRVMTGADDLAALNAGNPGGWVALWWAGLDADADPPLIEWFVAEVDGEAVGMAAALRAPAASGGYGMGLIHVLPAHRRQGVGTALLAAVESSIRDAELPGLSLSWHEGDDDGRAAAEAWGLRETARHRENVLDLTTIDRTAFAERADLRGPVLAALPPFEEVTAAQWERLYAFFSARWVEAPDSAAGGEAPPYPVFRAMVTEPGLLLTAEDGGELVGLTCVSRRPGTSTVVNTFFTGVVPAARGRGLATALKCHHALVLADHGMTRLHTQNMDGNEPILAANRTLGFQVAGGYVDVVRDLSSTASPTASPTASTTATSASS